MGDVLTNSWDKALISMGTGAGLAAGALPAEQAT